MTFQEEFAKIPVGTRFTRTPDSTVPGYVPVVYQKQSETVAENINSGVQFPVGYVTPSSPLNVIETPAEPVYKPLSLDEQNEVQSSVSGEFLDAWIIREEELNWAEILQAKGYAIVKVEE